MTNHKVLGDLLHVLIVEEAVEAQFVCRAAPGDRKGTEGGVGEEEDRGRKIRMVLY